MILTSILVIIAILPYIFMLFILIDHRHHKVVIRKAKKYFVLSVLPFLFVFSISIYFYMTWGFSLFPSKTNMMIMGGVVGLILLIVIISFILGAVTSPKPLTYALKESVFGLGMFSLFFFGIFLTMIFAFPAGEKQMYVDYIEAGEERLNEIDSDKYVVLDKAASFQNCYSNTSTCRQSDYDNLILMQNRAGEDIRVDLYIVFYNSDHEKMDELEIEDIIVGEGEVIPVIPEENLDDDEWNRYTNRTERFLSYIQYKFEAEPLAGW